MYSVFCDGKEFTVYSLETGGTFQCSLVLGDAYYLTDLELVEALTKWLPKGAEYICLYHQLEEVIKNIHMVSFSLVPELFEINNDIMTLYNFKDGYFVKALTGIGKVMVMADMYEAKYEGI